VRTRWTAFGGKLIAGGGAAAPVGFMVSLALSSIGLPLPCLCGATRSSDGTSVRRGQDAARIPPHSLAKQGTARHARAQHSFFKGRTPMSTALTDQIHGLIAPFNKKGVELSDATTFAGDLEWDSLTVMDFVAEVEDTFDIIISMNMQAEIETVGQLIAAVEKLQG
jgi:acyl carrier protein